jgi:hypothetical protein
VIERDGWTLFLEALEKANRWPLRVRLEALEGEHPGDFRPHSGRGHEGVFSST